MSTAKTPPPKPEAPLCCKSKMRIYGIVTGNGEIKTTFCCNSCGTLKSVKQATTCE